jgi:hypothetical protein
MYWSEVFFLTLWDVSHCQKIQLLLQKDGILESAKNLSFYWKSLTLLGEVWLWSENSHIIRKLLHDQKNPA